MGIKLSVAIPTHNGAATIRETLESIISQVEDSVEIVISDNASTDETAEIVREYQARYPVIRYFRNDENLGADRNIDLAVRRSQGEYVWLFSDDDKMAPGGVHKVLTVLESHNDLAAMFVNAGSYSEDFGRCDKKQVLRIEEDMFCSTANDFLKIVTLTGNMLSCNVVQRALWRQEEARYYWNSQCIQHCVVLDLLPEHSAYCISTPYVMYRGGSLRWGRESFLKIVLFFSRHLQELPEDHYNKVIIKELLNNIARDLPRVIYVSKRSGMALSVSISCLTEAKVIFSSHLSFWLLDLPLLLLPGWVYRLVLRVYRIPVVKRTYEQARRWLQQRFARV